MSDERKHEDIKQVINITIEGNELKVVFATGSLPLLSFAVRMASLELDNLIIGKQAEKSNKLIQTASDIVTRLRGGNGKRI